MPCDNLAIQRAKLVPKILDELLAEEGARKTFLAMVQNLVPGRPFRLDVRTSGYPYVMVEATRGSLSVYINAEGLTAYGTNDREVAALKAGLESKLEALASMFAGARARRAVEVKFPGTKTERVAANTYRQRVRI